MLDSDANDDNTQREAQLKALLDLLASFFFTSTGDKPFSSGLVHFLAVLGIDSDTDQLRTAKSYSYMLASVVYCMRVLSVEHLLPSASRDEQTDKDRERFLQHRERYLANSSYSLSQGGNSSQPSLEFLPWDQKYRALRSSYHVG
jgi:hypothetical protein